MIRKFALPTVLLAAAVLAASASAAPRMEFALQDDAVFVDQRWMARDQALAHARALGTKRLRVNLLWARSLVSGAEHRTPPAGGPRYDFSKVDALHAATAARGIKLQLTVTGPAPAWATKDRKVGGHQPDLAKFRAFVRTVAAHFKGRVDRYSVWNEPNLSAWLAPTRKQYRTLYKAAYSAMLQYQLVDGTPDQLWHSAIFHNDGRPMGAYAGLARAAAAIAR